MNEYYDPQFCGTESYWKHPLGSFVYTDSVKYFAEEKQAWWTLDVIGSYLPELKKYPFLILTFVVKDGGCKFSAREDINRTAIVSQGIPYTDLDENVLLYMQREEGSYPVLMFPSDY
jgi:hypothetical protein